MPSFIEVLFGGGSPEQRKELAIRMLKERQKNEEMAKAAMPLIAEIRKSYLELQRLGFEDDRCTRARRDMAMLADDLNAFLISPPPPDEL